jgi:hypothetical protein
MNRKKSNGKVVITRKSIKGENSQAARVARFDMEKAGITPLEENQVFTPEELDELYRFDPENEPYWNR